MRNIFRALFFSAGLALATVPALAHHSLNAVFDESQSVTLNGVVSKVEWVNPHVYLYIDVRDTAGKRQHLVDRNFSTEHAAAGRLDAETSWATVRT